MQSHVRDLAETLIALGHDVSVLAPGDDDTPGLPRYVVPAGRAVPDPVQRLGGPAALRRRCPPPGCGAGCATGAFDVVHVHEPAPPSLSLLAC